MVLGLLVTSRAASHAALRGGPRAARPLLRRTFARRTCPIMMPEGPEVSSLVDKMNAHIGGGRFVVEDAVVLSGRYAKAAPEGWDDLRERLPLRIESVRCHGKFIYFELGSDGPAGNEEGGPPTDVFLWSTLGLMGGWTLRQQPQHARLALALRERERPPGDSPPGEGSADGQGTARQVLTFYDQRNFGTFKATFGSGEIQSKLERLGRPWLCPIGEEPSDATARRAPLPGIALSLDDFMDVVRRQQKTGPRRPVAVFLMAQDKLAGLGNYILSEVMYAVRMHPEAAMQDVDDALWEEVYEAACEVFSASYSAQAGLADESSFRWKVYRQQQDPEGRPVERITGPHKRTLHIVRSVQTRGLARDGDAGGGAGPR